MNIYYRSKIKCDIRNNLRFKLFIFLFLAFFVINRTNANDQLNVKIFSRNSRINQKEIKLFFITTNLIIKRILPKRTKSTDAIDHYTIVLLNEKKFKKVEILAKSKKELRFYLPEKSSLWMNNNKILSKIISKLLIREARLLSGKKYKSAPKWLINGVIAKIKRRLNVNKIPGIITYPAVHMYMQATSEPRLINLLNSSLKPSDGAAFTLFYETSDLILTAIQKLPEYKKDIRTIIELSATSDIPPKDSFNQIFGKNIVAFRKNTNTTYNINKNLDNNEIVNLWLIESAIRYSINIFNPSNATFAEKRFKKVEIVGYYPVIEKSDDSDQELRYCLLEDFAKKRDDIKEFAVLRKQKELELIRFEFSLPPSLQEPIRNIRLDLVAMGNNASYDYIKHYKINKKKFYIELEKLNELERYISKIERQYVPESWRYGSEFELINVWDKKRETLWPSLTKYLDSIEDETLTQQ